MSLTQALADWTSVNSCFSATFPARIFCHFCVKICVCAKPLLLAPDQAVLLKQQCSGVILQACCRMVTQERKRCSMFKVADVIPCAAHSYSYLCVLFHQERRLCIYFAALQKCTFALYYFCNALNAVQSLCCGTGCAAESRARCPHLQNHGQ